jgi:hypothetical protein
MYAINFELASDSGRSTPYPFPRMKRGDAFTVLCRVDDQAAMQNRLGVSANYYQRKFGWRFATKTQRGVRGQPSGVRVERVA